MYVKVQFLTSQEVTYLDYKVMRLILLDKKLLFQYMLSRYVYFHFLKTPCQIDVAA